jgi:hypothetical protein
MTFMQTAIELIPAHKIDRDKWNSCIQSASNGLIYSHATYLDHMADNWSGLVMNDYAAVMPVPWRKKWGVRYMYVPAFMQQLGITGTLTDEVATTAIKRITREFLYGDLHFNASNTFIPALFPTVTRRRNRIVDLKKNYADLFNDISSDGRRNILSASQAKLHYREGKSTEAMTTFLQQMKYPGAPDSFTMNRFHTACTLFDESGQHIVRCVMDSHEQLLAAFVGLKDERRIYNLLNLTTPEGRKCSANYYLFNELLKEWSGNPLLLDLEGSELPGVQAFYLHWGGDWETYFHVHHNRLLWPLRLLKH